MKLHHRPLFIIAAAWVLGVICAVGIRENLPAGVCAAAVILIAACLIPARSVPGAARLVFLCVFAASIMRTVVFQQVPLDDISNYADGKTVHLRGTIASDPDSADGKSRFVIRANEVRTYSGKFTCTGYAAATLYPPGYGQASGVPAVYPSYGESVEIHGKLKLPLPPSNPGQADYGRYLGRRRIHCLISASADEFAVRRPAGFSAAHLAASIKLALTRKADELFPPVQGSLLLGIILGNYAALPYETQSSFMRTGTMHLLAASGYNCGILILIFGWMMRFLTVPRTAMHITLISAVWLFALMAGCGPSIVRAAIMVTLILMAYIIRRTVDYLNIALFAALAILLANPLYLYDIGFQLSFGAVLAIMLMMPLFDRFMPPKESGSGVVGKTGGRAIRWGAAVILTSAVSIAATWPITAYYFNYFSLSAILSNVLVASLVVPITAFGIGALALGFIAPAAGHALAWITGLLLKLMLWIVDTIGGYDWSAVSVHSPSPTVILLYYVGVVCGIEYLYRKVAHAEQNTDTV